MKLAVTGATGFIGSRLIERLAGTGHSCRALTRRPMPPRPNVTWVEGALDRPDTLAALVEGADAVIHIAGLLHGRTAAQFDAVNVAGTRAMVDASRAAGVRRFVHLSSLAARHPEISLYGATKAKSEDVVSPSGLDFAIVRPPAVYGPGDRETLDLFRMAKYGLVPMPSEGRLSLIHADDLVDLLIALTEPSAPSSLIVEPDDGRPTSQREFAHALGQAVGRRIRPVLVPNIAMQVGAVIDGLVRRERATLTPDRASYFAHEDWSADPSRGVPPQLWQPRIPAEQGLAATAAWYRKEGWL
ncbi:MAG: NAD-dependent epimerase/dehydratase family protein [Sphingomicrobium sp.]